jgi:hypothetical protein
MMNNMKVIEIKKKMSLTKYSETQSKFLIETKQQTMMSVMGEIKDYVY